jgi:hypothetical protein
VPVSAGSAAYGGQKGSQSRQASPLLGMTLRVPPFDPGDPGEALNGEQVPDRIVTLGKAGKVGINPS